jgi:hypothetical protein
MSPQNIQKYFNYLIAGGLIRNVGQARFLPTCDLSNKNNYKLDSAIFEEDYSQITMDQYDTGMRINPPRAEHERAMWDDAIEDLKALDEHPGDII